MRIYTDEVLQAIDRWNGIPVTPSRESLRTPKGLPVLRNAFVEKWIARAHPIVPGVWVLPLAGWGIWAGFQHQGLAVMAGLFVAGMIFFTLLEYTLHMLLFHMEYKPTMSPGMKRTLFMLHGYHHEFPSDPYRLVMPIIIAWPMAAVIGTALWFALGASYFHGFFSGLLIGYLAYDWMHYYVHHFRPKTRVGKYLHEYHIIHHFMDQKHNFGISSPLWDWVVGKAREPKNSPFKSKEPVGGRPSEAR